MDETILNGADLSNIEFGNMPALIGHYDYVRSIVISNDGKKFVTGSEDTTIKVWSLESWENIKTLKGHSDHITSVVISNDNKNIVSGSKDKTIKIWNLETG